MKNKFVALFSKINKGLIFILGINIILFGFMSSLELFDIISSENAICFLFFYIFIKILLTILYIITPFIMICTSPKFTIKEKKNIVLYYVSIIVILFIIFGLTKIIYIKTLIVFSYFIYLFCIIILFWTHRKKNYKEETKE